MPDRMGLCAFYWLKMVLYIKTAIVASIFMIGAASGYIAQAWRYDAQIADIQAQHATALASANQKALDDTIKMQRTKDEAIKAAEQRAKTQAANAAVLRTERDGLRAQLAATTVQLPSASCPSVRAYGIAASTVIGECSARLVEMAEQADRAIGEVILLRDAWPSTKK